MTTLTIQNFDEELKARLREQAAMHGRTIEEEVATILRSSLVASPHPKGFGQRIHQRFVKYGIDELDLPSRVDAACFPELPE